MNEMILVTGGAGFVGSHTCVALLEAGHSLVVVDNLSNASEESLRRVARITDKTMAFERVDIRDGAGMRRVFDKYRVGAVVHFAGLKAVGESVEKPLQYYDNN